jgi:hypothetical protein
VGTHQELVCPRFGSLGTEFLFGDSTPKVGETFSRGDEEWVVTKVGTDSRRNFVVTLERAGNGKVDGHSRLMI